MNLTNLSKKIGYAIHGFVPSRIARGPVEQRVLWGEQTYNIRSTVGTFFDEFIPSKIVSFRSVFKVKQLASFEPNTNPYWEDTYRMGMALGSNIEVMHAQHPSEVCKYIILVDRISGQRIRVDFKNAK